MRKISDFVSTGMMVTGALVALVDVCDLNIRWSDGLGVFCLGLLIFLFSYIEDMSHYE